LQRPVVDATSAKEWDNQDNPPLEVVIVKEEKKREDRDRNAKSLSKRKVGTRMNHGQREGKTESNAPGTGRKDG
jgi:hypothetical protein